MATGIAGIWNPLAATHSMKTQQTVQNEAAEANSNNANENSATISANDFLTLLVTEMKNQDPTADTDPNEYINQLVQVNSLEQLISINQTLLTDSVTSATGNALQRSGMLNSMLAPKDVSNPVFAAGSAIASAPFTSGNLSIPANHGAALRVAEALAGHTNPQ